MDNIIVSWSWSACTQHHVNPELNWTGLDWSRHMMLMIRCLAHCSARYKKFTNRDTVNISNWRSEVNTQPGRHQRTPWTSWLTVSLWNCSIVMNDMQTKEFCRLQFNFKLPSEQIGCRCKKSASSEFAINLWTWT